MVKDGRAIEDFWYLEFRKYFYSIWLVEPRHSQVYRKLKLRVLNTGTKPQRKAILYGGYTHAASGHA